MRMPRFIFLLMAASVWGCQHAPSGVQAPPDIRGLAVPAPTADHPNAYNYLPEMLAGRRDQGEEVQLLRLLAGMPPEQSRPFLEKLGYIQDRELTPYANYSMDQGEMRAQMSHMRLLQSFQFSTPAGDRHAMIFDKPSAGSAGNTRPALAILTDGSYRPILARRVYLFRSPAATSQSQADDALVVLHTLHTPSDPNKHVQTLRFRFTATSIEQIGYGL